MYFPCLNGHVWNAFGVQDAPTAQTIGTFLADNVFHIAETHFFFRELEACDQMHVDALRDMDDQRDLSTYR